MDKALEVQERIRRSTRCSDEIDDILDDVVDNPIAIDYNKLKLQINVAYNTGSFAKSMEEYEHRRNIIEHKIMTGELVDLKGKKTQQLDSTYEALKYVNLDNYTDANQARRRHIKKHPQFVTMLGKFWNSIDMIKTEEGHLTKSPYLLLCFKISTLAFPPPLDKDIMLESALQDWRQDTQGVGYLTEKQFTKSIFQLVDTWTESCDAEEYLQLLYRIAQGVFFESKSHGLVMKADELIRFDPLFCFLGDVMSEGGNKDDDRDEYDNEDSKRKMIDWRKEAESRLVEDWKNWKRREKPEE